MLDQLQVIPAKRFNAAQWRLMTSFRSATTRASRSLTNVVGSNPNCKLFFFRESEYRSSVRLFTKAIILLTKPQSNAHVYMWTQMNMKTSSTRMHL